MHRILDFLIPWRPGGIRQHHLSALAALSILLKVVLLPIVFSAGFLVGQHVAEHGGYNRAAERLAATQPGHFGGGTLPASYSLLKYVQRVHAQLGSEACVGQTVSQMVEIMAAERGIRQPYSAGYVWNRIDGGQDAPTTYADAFRVLQTYGDAPLAAFWPDGQINDYAVWPWAAADAAARPYRSTSWYNVPTWDVATIKFDISHGLPLAFAAPWFDSWINHYGDASDFTYPSGKLQYWHSVTAIGYNADGVVLLNSFGTGWGYEGRVVVPWAVLAAMGQRYGAVLAVTDLTTPWPKPAPTPKPTPKAKHPHRVHILHMIQWPE